MFVHNPLLSSYYISPQFTFFTQCTLTQVSNNSNLSTSRGLLQFYLCKFLTRGTFRVHLPKPVESPCSIHQAGILVTVHCLPSLVKQVLCLSVAQRKLPFTLCYLVKSYLRTTWSRREPPHAYSSRASSTTNY